MNVLQKITMTGREFNHDRSKAKKLADQGPVVITDRGTPRYVLMTYEEYGKLAGDSKPKGKSIAELLSMDTDDDYEFEIPKLEDEDFGVKPAEFD